LKPGIYSEELKALASSIDGKVDISSCQFNLERDNPFCGDRVKLGIDLKKDRVCRVQILVRACLICRAAAATLQKSVVGLPISDLIILSGKLKNMLSEGDLSAESFQRPWQNLDIFCPVSAHPSRHSCVLLPFTTLSELLVITRE
tara:strand:+ start:961 stop:1395 length:435 start_codon:yes stop_codon:yes gene_type:complete